MTHPFWNSTKRKQAQANYLASAWNVGSKQHWSHQVSKLTKMATLLHPGESICQEYTLS